MEESIWKMCSSLAYFCNHLETNCDVLKQSVERRPLPLDSASTMFIQCLKRRLASTGTDLNLIESMSLGTVSFEELLGHCNEVYKKNQNDIVEIENHLRSFGYVPEPEVKLEDEAFDDSSASPVCEQKKVDADAILDDSLSLEDLGLSDAGLATIASEANNDSHSSDMFLSKSIHLHEKRDYAMPDEQKSDSKYVEDIQGAVDEDSKVDESLQHLINLLKDDYESLPSYMKTLASWEDLLTAVEKLNLVLSEKQNAKTGNFFHQDELASLDLGHKGRSYLLLLVRMNRLVVETVDGLISYRVL